MLSTPQSIAKTWLWGGALVFLVIGVGFLLAPVRWGAMVEISLPTAMARTDFRATYGGFDFAIGVFLALAAARAEWLRSGLVVMGLAGAGFGGGRVIGMLVEGTAAPLMLVFAAIELSVAVGSLYLLRRGARSERRGEG